MSLSNRAGSSAPVRFDSVVYEEIQVSLVNGRHSQMGNRIVRVGSVKSRRVRKILEDRLGTREQESVKLVPSRRQRGILADELDPPEIEPLAEYHLIPFIGDRFRVGNMKYPVMVCRILYDGDRGARDIVDRNYVYGR